MKLSDHEYTKEDFEELHKAYWDSNLISNGRPDRYQYYQNLLNQKTAEFLLKPYLTSIEKDD